MISPKNYWISSSLKLVHVVGLRSNLFIRILWWNMFIISCFPFLIRLPSEICSDSFRDRTKKAIVSYLLHITSERKTWTKNNFHANHHIIFLIWLFLDFQEGETAVAHHVNIWLGKVLDCGRWGVNKLLLKNVQGVACEFIHV